MPATPNTPKIVVSLDPWDSDQGNWEYISIPEENALGEPHASISNNRHTFEAGKTYLVPAPVAADVKDRLRAYQRSVVRVMRPNVDIGAQKAVSIGSTSTDASVDPSLAPQV